MEKRDETKDAIDYVENSESRKHAFVDDQMPLPLLLEGLGADELKKIGRRATWKLDLIIMPAMTMYAISSAIASMCRSSTDTVQKLYLELFGSTKHRSRKAGGHHGRFGPDHHPVQHGRQCPLRWIQ
jgi:hypothetical protein